ncbi:MAG: hypothetical protein ACRDRG_03240 [Pseudonocardiaceae bacterium]
MGVFVANAVRGSADTRSRHGAANRVIWGDAFSRSMLRPVLDRAGLEAVVIADAEFRRCAACTHRFERPAGEDTCTSCGKPIIRHRARGRRVRLPAGPVRLEAAAEVPKARMRPVARRQQPDHTVQRVR